MSTRMDLTIAVHRDELEQALREFLPMRLTLGTLDVDADPDWIEIDRLETVTFLPGRGVTLTCAARVHHPLPILPDDYTVEHVALTMTPRIADGANGPVLAFALEIDELDMRLLPEFVDRVLVKRVNAALLERLSTIAWNFTGTLHKDVRLPRRFGLVTAVVLGPPQGEVEVTDEAIVLRLSLGVTFDHEDEAAHDAPRAA